MEIKFNALKKRVLRKKADKLRPLKSSTILPPDSYKKILLISNTNNPGISDKIHSFFPNAEAYQLYQRPEKDDRSGNHQYAVHDSDFNLSGSLKNVKLTKLLKESFDLVIDLSRNSVPLSFFAGSISSGLIIGRLTTQRGNIYDLLIDYGKDENEFLENIKKQLTLLSTNGFK